MNDVMTTNIKIFLLSLFEQGVKNFVVSPGSRSTPVVLLLAELASQRSEINIYIDVDERSASFFGLGLAKKNKIPVGLICTSGTAATEYASAVAEAKLSHIPLVVITSDRPAELSNIGAPQAINQNDLYHGNTKYFVNLNLQDDSEQTSKYVEFESQRTVARSLDYPRGPVQINLPLRKPLMPILDSEDPVVSKINFNSANYSSVVTDYKQILADKKVLIIAGPEELDYHSDLLALAESQNWPIMADVLSNTRNCSKYVINNGDLFIKTGTKEVLDYVKPDVILRFGGTLVSASISNWLKKVSSSAEIIYVGDHELNDYTLSTDNFVAGSEKSFIKNIINLNLNNSPAYLEKLIELNNFGEQKKNELQNDEFSELSIPKIIDDNITKSSNIFLSNSMPIRDFENYYLGTKTRSIFCNRGANGIDGVVSTAMATGIGSEDNVLFIGDLALFHDMNGLMMAKRYQIPMTIVVSNNNGGGIFSFLPQSKATDYFETLFGTPQDLKIADIATLYGFDYFQVSDKQQAINALDHDAKQKIIEIQSDRSINVKQHRTLETKFGSEINQFVIDKSK
ncbi:2-succinyl-5-enolpyruvyl-6-hydroxy-3-cyclohexene-1-carboxylic-acid synthase [Companilactobacillus mishanensis]|uniref:2-succinyl-5-enolpyruvyl-6-hydroxy-3- cyclohexene-1-carboxylic-acid synthase n=1 Tax=Companilactobacillus mishanensis TaxID=2486008 RepID=UPI001296F974|nr:2-succinyl-5-enolpyruvyl-6-hydroxy-3-cyclohexene-1-carboxylic-acid synthase [Companilactobacillus mishanensis]MQS88416.1 2-succinyl-5-enolpyruvyl-6-hydroxy-3-cyclohexene-1-carboxylic-acid synthase [Companilactobacillus mishanensis]